MCAKNTVLYYEKIFSFLINSKLELRFTAKFHLLQQVPERAIAASAARRRKVQLLYIQKIFTYSEKCRVVFIPEYMNL